MNIANKLGYLVVTDYIEANTGKDVSDALQKLILDNPHRTLFFPDGEYILSKPICTPANPKNAVHLVLSNFATLKASEDWSENEAMVRLGAAEPFNDITANGSNYGLEGGIIDGSGRANGISIDSGRETSIHNTSIKNTIIGIHVKWGANNRSSDADIHTVNIVGAGVPGTIGVLVQGHDNTFTNMRIASVMTGFKLESGTNILRNIHPLFIFEPALEGLFTESVAFLDLGGTNWYDNCYSDQFSTGFEMSHRTLAFCNDCFAMWYTSKGKVNTAIKARGPFNAIFKNLKVNFLPDNENAYLKLETGDDTGNGYIETPVFQEYLCQNKDYEKHLRNGVMWRSVK